MDLHERLLNAFRIECREHLEHIRSHFVMRDEGELARPEMDEVFRHAHSLKGAARATDLRPIEALAHRLETMLAQIRSGSRAFSSDMRVLAGRLVDTVEDWMAAFDAGKDLPDADAALALADKALDGDGAAAPLAQSEARAVPSEPIKASEPYAAGKAIQRPPPKSAPAKAGDEPIKVRAKSLDRLLLSAGALASGAADQSMVAKRLRQFEDVLGELDRAWRNLQAVTPDLRHRHERQVRNRAIERQAERIDKHLRWLGAEISQVRNQQHKSAWTVEQMAGELRRDIRQVRLIPAESVFAGFRKMVRDLARDLGMEIDFRTQGFDVEADRQVLEALRDPVMHLLRNALAHGIEPPEERVKAGKPATGRLSLSFLVEGLFLLVTIEDDGRGLNLQRIKDQAVDRGLIGPQEAEETSDGDLSRLIFMPGFSTAKEVGDIAGRGMGMSVVHEVAARLSGHAQWQPKEGPGTRFLLTVPLSVSSQRLLLLECQNQTYALAAEAVSRLCRIAASDVKQVEGRSLVLIDERQVPVRGLDDLLGLGQSGIKLSEGNFLAAIIDTPQGTIALAVDALSEVCEAVVKDVGFSLPHGSVVTGAILRPDGSVVVVLNAYEMIAQLDESDAAPALMTEERAAEESAPVILVADDSITTRTLEKSILEAHGYKVRVAVDGLDALIQLRASPVDLVVSDVEMPRIDGFALLKELKSDKKLAHIPVIMVTSLKRNEDIERGLELGAAAYLVKQKFDQTELLETIRQIL
ncbi:MAG: response regulator [Alphaproteobacteria bacterium]|nr:response regulator [Alphaproteobacteria bacterium]